MTDYLTPQQLLFIHARLITTTGGEHWVRDLGLLQSAMARPQATFDGADLYPDLCQKAAALMASLAQNHPFVDGNKRTALVMALTFLRINGVTFVPDQVAAVRMMEGLADNTVPEAEFARWLRKA